MPIIKDKRWLTTVSALALMTGLTMPANAMQDAEKDQAKKGGVDEIVVTAQRRSESIQDVPVAVTAFGAEAIDQMQIENFSDLAFFTPNVTFSKSNFTGSNFQIRGVGNTLVAASADSGVGVMVNDVPLNTPRLFETEYYDLAALEILRGPQGTLFGRNATSGTVNMKTAQPVLGETLGSFEAEYGSYNARRLEAMFNMPMGEKMALRLAGNVVKRNGYYDNIATDNDVDGRDSYSLRGSFKFEPSDSTTFDLMVSWFDEDSSRSRSAKTMCHNDPTGVLGCLPDTLEFESPNAFATLGTLLSSNFVLGPLGLFQYANGDPSLGAGNPDDFRQVALDFEPEYNSDELLITAGLTQDFGEKLTGSVVFGYHKTSVNSRTDYTGDLSPAINVPAWFAAVIPVAYSTYYANGSVPVSTIDEGGFTGIVGGNYMATPGNAGMSYDQSDSHSRQYSIEARLASNLDGPLNFQVGGMYVDYDSDFSYYVVSSGLDYFGVVLPELSGLPGYGWISPFYHNDTDRYALKSWALFGEVDYEISDTLKLTAGLRYTKDKKNIRDRLSLFDSVDVDGDGVTDLYPWVPFGTTEIDTTYEALGLGYRDSFTGGEEPAEWGEMTGRVVLNWTPDLDATDDTLFYASYSRGYKGGGFNPPAKSATTQQYFQPEFIDAFEIGMKNTLMDGMLSANFTAFYYNYKGLQVSKIVDRTSVNENIDAKIWGLEAELQYAPTENWLFNASAAYLNTKIGDSWSIDPRDPVQGDADYQLVKDYSNASNCAIQLNGNDPSLIPVMIAAAGDPFSYLAVPTPGQANGGAFSHCGGLEAVFAAMAPFFNPGGDPWYQIVGGLPVSLEGNELQQSPKFTMNLGAQYTHYMESGNRLELRADYYIQSSMYGRIFNRPIDKIESWDVINMKATLRSENDTWNVSAFIQNLTNNDAITGHYLSDASSGNFTNVFALEPRRYGITLGYNF